MEMYSREEILITLRRTPGQATFQGVERLRSTPSWGAAPKKGPKFYHFESVLRISSKIECGLNRGRDRQTNGGEVYN
jgi:hypothetical protein